MANEVLEKMASKAMWFTLSVVATLALAPRMARAESGSVIVTGGGEVKYTDPTKFAKVFIENGTASWSLDGADLAPDDIYQNCQPYGLSISAEVGEAGREEGASQ